MTIRFDEAWSAAKDVASQIREHGIPVAVVRDLVGRITLILDDRTPLPPEIDELVLAAKIRDCTALFAGFTPLVLASELISPADFFEAPDAIRVTYPATSAEMILLERGVVGGQWTRVAEGTSGRRVTLYGFKGGVGRSTAAFMLARHLAARELCVLVVDLDLESPGIGSLLQRADQLPDFGIVDVMTESAVGNELDFEFVARSTVDPLPGNGEIWLAPAGGRDRDGYTYLPKLNRIYLDLPATDGQSQTTSFSERLDQAVKACEERVAHLSRRPDVILLDSRAGIHDIAAAAITQLSDLTLLFAANSAQTWSGYNMLFRQWATNPETARRIRERLKMVAAMVPHESSDSYLDSYRDVAQQHLSETLYDDVTGDDVSGFNPPPSDASAPHYPLPILFSRDLTGLDPATRTDWHNSELVITAYRQFLDGATELILDDQGEGAPDGFAD